MIGRISPLPPPEISVNYNINMKNIESFRSPKVKIAPSKIADRGIFAKEKIHKDELVAIKNGYLLSKE
jgi:hypothetical protein